MILIVIGPLLSRSGAATRSSTTPARPGRSRQSPVREAPFHTDIGSDATNQSRRSPRTADQASYVRHSKNLRLYPTLVLAPGTFARR